MNMGARKYVDNIEANSKDTNVVDVHHVPFKIEYEGAANVDVKFANKSVPNEDNGQVLSNQFRGRPLQGQKFQLPETYEGLIVSDLKDSNSTLSDSSAAHGEVSLIKKFDSFTYWNWDRVPSSMDKHTKLLDWIELSHVLHNSSRPLDTSEN